MATFTWTTPDPLISREDVVTRSIYITELQIAVNVRRAEISQSALSFIDQSVGQTYKLSAIEELKTTTNQLAIDFGYSSGVEDAQLLGRPYVEHPKDSEHNPLAGFPIINDLRQVLELLEQQIILDGIFAMDWIDGPPQDPSLTHEFGIWDEGVPEFWTTIPKFAQVGGDICDIGESLPAQCDSTASGQGPYVSQVTDRSIIISNNDEGPYPGPYFTPPATSPFGVMDETYVYTHGLIGTGVPWNKERALYRRKRYIPFAHNPYVLVGSIPLIGQNTTHIDKMVLGKSNVLFYADGESQGPDLFYSPSYGILSKIGSVVKAHTLIPFQNLIGIGSGRHWISDFTLYNGNWVGTYQETGWEFPGGIYGDGIMHVGSCLMTISNSGAISVSDVLIKESPFTGGYTQAPDVSVAHSESGPKYWKYMSSPETPIGKVEGLFYWKRPLIIGSGGEIQGVNTVDCWKVNGSSRALMDYRGIAVNGHLGHWSSKANWATIADSVPEIPVQDFETIGIRDAVVPNTIEVSVTYIDKIFRYGVQTRKESSSTFTDKRTFEVIEMLNDGGTSTALISLSAGDSYYIRLITETGQGLKIGPETFIL